MRKGIFCWCLSLVFLGFVAAPYPAQRGFHFVSQQGRGDPTHGYVLSPRDQSVATGSKITLELRNPDPLGNLACLGVEWRLNGVEDPSLVISQTDQTKLGFQCTAVWTVPDVIPHRNPVAISVRFVRYKNGKPDGPFVTLVTNLRVVDYANEITIDGNVYSFESRATGLPELIQKTPGARGVVDPNMDPRSTLHATFSGGITGAVLLGDGKAFAISWPGKGTGTFAWNLDAPATQVGGTIGSKAYSMVRDESTPPQGTITVTEYGEVGKPIKGTFQGTLWECNPPCPPFHSVQATGKFSLMRAPDGN